MEYDWKEIFKTKSEQELYEIYKGDSSLPTDVIPFALNELESRGFNFDDIEYYQLLWRIKHLQEIQRYYNRENHSLKDFYISWNYLTPFIFLLYLIHWLYSKFTIHNIEMILWFTLFLVFSGLISLIINLYHIKKKDKITVEIIRLVRQRDQIEPDLTEEKFENQPSEEYKDQIEKIRDTFFSLVIIFIVNVVNTIL